MDEKIIRESGILLVDKLAGWTSHDVVAFIRRFGVQKIGHCGTLDPAATGLLVLVLGRATKLADKLSGQDKVYEGVMRIGIETFSHDADGEVVREADWSQVTPEQLRAVAEEFVGDQMQTPPMVSAVKKGGKKLYELARKGITVEREPRPVTVHELELVEIALPDASFRVACSKGFYVRTLCHDIGAKIGCGAHLKALRRTKSGRFSISDAYSMEEIKTWRKPVLFEKFIPLPEVLNYL